MACKRARVKQPINPDNGSLIAAKDGDNNQSAGNGAVGNGRFENTPSSGVDGKKPRKKPTKPYFTERELLERERARHLTDEQICELDILTTRQAAQYLRLSGGMLHSLRRRGKGPKYFMIGLSVRYRREDIETWIQVNLKT